jgi:hypothetical protein
VAVSTTVVITLFSFTGVDAQAANNIEFTTQPIVQTEMLTMLDNSLVSIPVDIERSKMAIQMEHIKFDTADKLADAFFSMDLEVNELYSYRPLFINMVQHLSKIDIVKATADTDPDDKSLEFVMLLSKGVMISVEKPLDSLPENNALVTIVHQREVLYSNEMDMDEMSVIVQNIENKLQAI